jgi:hypothetical protein
METKRDETEVMADAFREYYKDMAAYHDECEKANRRVLKAIQSVKGSDFYEDLTDVFDWVHPSGKFELVDEPSGDIQNENYGKIRRVWVDQWSVGDSGDSFSGHVYVKLKLGMWLKMYFEC